MATLSVDSDEFSLQHTALFKQVPADQVKELMQYLQESTFKKGSAIFNEGDTDHRMYLLERGRVKLVRHSNDNRVQLLSIHTPGEILGEIPVFDPSGGPRTASAISITNNTRVLWLENDVLFHWLNNHPSVAVDMLQVLAARMRANNERIS
ncbi:Crp/Fnr family transcriptional regulator, partial [Bifidobacteriaceae bacterium NR017]